MAEKLSRDLAGRGLIILSGMARGIDTAAHKGALEAKRPTIAVWGTGVDVVYPKENKALAEQIVATGGLILSELPLRTLVRRRRTFQEKPDPERDERWGAGD